VVLLQNWLNFGSPKGIRTPVSAVRGRHPRPLDDRAIKNMAAGQGFEPWRTDPESVVLPLHHPAAKQNLYSARYLL
jgi:hypothetical protein